MAAVELLLVRHGESEGNLAAAEADRAGAERIDLPARDADVRLSVTGREQAHALGRHLGRLDPSALPEAIWVSTYRRARETTAIALEAAGLDLPIRVDERLRDRELGILDGYTVRGVKTLFPEEATRRAFLGKFYHRPPGGESWADLALRIRSVLRDIDENEAGRVMIVSHDAVSSVIRYVTERIEENDLLEDARRNPMPNTGVTRLVRPSGAGRWTPDRVNSVEHLEAENAEITEHSGEADDTEA